MKKTMFVVLVLFVVSVLPAVANTSIDLGVVYMSNEITSSARPLGGNLGLHFLSKNNKALITALSVGVLSPELTGDDEYPVILGTSGVMVGLFESVFAGCRVGLYYGGPDDALNSFGVVAVRYQSTLEGLGFFMDVEVSLTGAHNRASAGVNLTL